MIVFPVKETEYALMKLIMIHHVENQDAKVVVGQVYVNVENQKNLVLNVKGCLYANIINAEDDVLYAIQTAKSYALVEKALLVVKNVVKNVLVEKCFPDVKYMEVVNYVKHLYVKQEVLQNIMGIAYLAFFISTLKLKHRVILKRKKMT